MFIQCTWNRVSPSFLDGKGFLDARKTKSSPTIPPPTPLTSICGTIIPLLSCTFVKTSENPSRPSIPFQGLVVGTTDREERFRIPSQKKRRNFSLCRSFIVATKECKQHVQSFCTSVSRLSPSLFASALRAVCF